MPFCFPRSPFRVLVLSAAALGLASLPHSLHAAEASGDHAAKGKLSEAERTLEPLVEAASDQGKDALTRMKLPPGIKASLWAAEPMLANPVAFNIDAHGRVFVSETYRYGSSTLDIRGYMWMLEDDMANRTQDDFLATVRRNFGETGVKELSLESERLRLIEDTDGDGVADKSGFYAEDFRTPLDGVASGVLIHRNDVWFTNIPSLWKFTGKDKAETRTEVFKGFGVRFSYTGHDFHGLVLGPDGRIYASIGDRGASVQTKEGNTIAIPDTGGVFRWWPDGSGLELFASGLRNPQSLVFNEYGDLFTGDNDSDQGDQERLVHIAEGGDSGWRVGYQHAPRGQAGPWNSEKLWHPRHSGQPAYIIPPICNIEDGPSGLAYYPGTGLTPEYAGKFFITHFKGAITNSGIYTYQVKPSGASYAIESSAPFLTGALPTDVRFGPDGKLYYSDWAEGWPKSKRGRIYTMFDANRANDPALKEIQRIIASDFTQKSDDELATLLTHADWRIRLEAQYTLAERGDRGLAKLSAAAQGAHELARRHAVWGLGQIARKNPRALEALRPLLKHADAEVRAQAANTLGDLRDKSSAEAFVAGLGDDSARVKYFSAIALGKIKHTSATPALFAATRANDNTDLYVRHALVQALVACATPEQLSATAQDASGAVRLVSVLALRHLAHEGITAFLADTDPAIVREAAIAINDAPITAAYPALAAFVSKPVRDQAVMLRALNATFRLGGDENAVVLANLAARDGSATLRREALSLLAIWPKPPKRDRIVGIYRPLAEESRPTESIAAALLPTLDTIFAAHTPDNVQTAAMDVVVSLKLSGALPALRRVVSDAAESSTVRIAALKALDKLADPEIASVLPAANNSDIPEFRLAALPIATRLSPEAATTTLAALLDRGTPREQQTAYRALGAVADPRADDVFLDHLARLKAGQVAPAAQLDLLDAAALRADPRVKQALADREAALALDPDPLAPFRVALHGGTFRDGIDNFRRNPVLQCIRCHRVGDEVGGEAGPNLGGIGARVSREYILESIIKPSAKIAPGFEIVNVTKNNGEAVVGTLVERNEKFVRLKTGEETLEIPAGVITNVETAPSAMPEIAALVLTKAEIRDLVEVVASFKTPPEKPQTTLRALQHLSDDDAPSPPSGH